MAWEHDLLHESDLDTVGNAVRNVTGYMREVIADRRRNPRDDFISYGIQAEIRGRPLTDDELIGRSEEHTSELQSLMRISYAVFCLNKKKIHKTPIQTDKDNI